MKGDLKNKETNIKQKIRINEDENESVKRRKFRGKQILNKKLKEIRFWNGNKVKELF